MISPSQLDARILIVDDQESNVLLLQAILDDEGYSNLMTTRDPRDVAALVGRFQPDLILLDLMMPHLDGYAVMGQLRLIIPSDAYLPILVLTADATLQAKRRALAMGAKDFLAKPFDQLEVLLRIRNLLETRALHLQQQQHNQILEMKVSERTAHIQRQLERLTALHIISTAIAGNLDLPGALKIVVDYLVTQLGMDAVDVLLLNPLTQTLEYVAGRGFNSTVERTNVSLCEGFAGLVATDGFTLYVPDLKTTDKALLNATPSIYTSEGFVTYIGIPLIARGKVEGVLQIFHRTPYDAGKEWLEFMETLGGQIAIAVDGAQLFTGLQHLTGDLLLAYDATIYGWSKALDLRDKETEGHCVRVAEMTVEMARAMDMSEADLEHIRRGALLHDIGKMAVPDSILFKPGPLTDEERVIMQQHPQDAIDMLSAIAFLRPALDIPYSHHEKWDGTGYPRGLKGEQIPIAARLFAVVDVWDALLSDRPYRKAWEREKVLAYIKSLSGTHFDPRAVALFFRVISLS